MSLSSSGITPSGIFNRAGLFHRAGIFNTFSPLSLNPLLAYEAESSMVAPFERPTLDLDPSNPSSLDIITATRAGVATYTDADGVIQTASPNTVRVDHSLGYPAILVEPSSRNLVEDALFTRASTATAEYGFLAPDGSFTATKISNVEERIGERATCGNVPASPSADYVGSCWVKGSSGDVAALILKRYSDGAFRSSGNVYVTLTGEWQRVTDLVMTTAADNNAVTFVLLNDVSTTADEVYLWQGQIEEGSVSTSTIKTYGSPVTRAADNLVIDGTDFSDFYNATEGTFFVTAQFKDPYAAQAIFMGQTSSQLYLYSNTGLPFYAYDGAGSASYGSVSANKLSNFAISYTASTFSISKDGNGPTSPASASGDFGNSTVLRIGSGYSNTANGHIKRLIYWPYHSDNL